MQNNTDNKQQNAKMITLEASFKTILPVRSIEILTMPNKIIKYVYFCYSPFSLN